MTTSLFPIAAVVPLIMTALLSWLWWDALSKPWLYVSIAAVVLYSLFGAILFWALSHLGIAAPPPGSQSVGYADLFLLELMIGGVAVGTGLLWGLKQVLSN